MSHSDIPEFLLKSMIKHALEEDLGGVGDLTSRAVIPDGITYSAKLNARDMGVLSGMQIAEIAFLMIDKKIEIDEILLPMGFKKLIYYIDTIYYR